MLELEADPTVGATQKVAELKSYGESHGYSLNDLIEEITTLQDSYREDDYLPTDDSNSHAAANLLNELLDDGFDDPQPSSTSLSDIEEQVGICKPLPRKPRRATIEMFAAELRSSQLGSSQMGNSSRSLVDVEEQIEACKPTPTQPGVAPSTSIADIEDFGTFEMPRRPRRSTVDKFAEQLRRSQGYASSRSLVDVEEQNEVCKALPPRGLRRASDAQWTTMRDVVGKRDSSVLLAPAFHPWARSDSQQKCVKRLSDHVMSTWGIMYCGGSQPVITALREISIDYNVDLHIDSFAW